MKKLTVFISYSHANSQFVDWLADKLKASGIDVWIDKWMIKVGDSITQKINEGIGASDFLIVVLSRASVNSKWVREELNAALIKNVEQEMHAFIRPVLLEECEIPSLLQHRKYANFKDDPEQAFQELLEVIQPSGLMRTTLMDKAWNIIVLLERPNEINELPLYFKSPYYQPLPQLNPAIENPALCRCMLCWNYFWIDERIAIDWEFLKIYEPFPHQPAVYDCDAAEEFCPICLSGEGALEECKSCGKYRVLRDEDSLDDWWDDPLVTLDEAKQR